MVRVMRRIYQGWFVLVSAALVVQLYLAGYGVFAFKGLGPFDAHRALGDLIGIAILLGIGGAFAARVPWRLTVLNIALFVLMLVQASLAYAGIQAVAAFHVVNGVLIFLGALYLTWEAVRLPMPESAPVATAAAATTP